jgi:hypothetical protein
VIVRIDERLREEAARVRLVFACPSCAQFEPEAGICALGYPNEDHVNPSLDARSDVVFCKAFELW